MIKPLKELKCPRCQTKASLVASFYQRGTDENASLDEDGFIYYESSTPDTEFVPTNEHIVCTHCGAAFEVSVITNILKYQAVVIALYSEGKKGDLHDVFLSCPYCDNWESLGADEPRHHFNAFEILKWIEDNTVDSPEHDITLMKCCDCEKEFTLIWDRTNTEPSEREEE